ncbi:xanthine dehydrogenase family protein subunit M [Saccharopolyspora sp. K220]|uniref:FAD binding domain-containing protein n=1 Tax=Saccharopolyspora soli TaxID=2926618 RepID=UPI001F56B291|nr:xanthine dehydrogenase family protein subunit M [Saccharopolyspora soli]MCI2422251.1 xanthine dehydrogenase family protein subunit M [Saccharopolyspora soli]
MKPRPFTYHAPTSVPEALELLAEHSNDAKVLGGGQSLVPLLNFRMASPEHLVDINRLPELDTVVRERGGWRIPALVRQRTAERSPELAAAFPLLPMALSQVAHPQIRNRGTVCGSAAHADPAAELPAVLTALGATMHVASTGGTRAISADDFFIFHFTTAMRPDELLVGIGIDDLPPGTTTGFAELAARHGDFALAAVAGVVTRDDGGTVRACRLVAAGVAGRPFRLAETEATLLGNPLTHEALVAAQHAARLEVDPPGDIHAPTAYRKQLVGVLTRRVLSSMS